jgi:Uma2 family endonuclease
MFDLALLAPERLRPLRVREYDRLVAEGAFADERVELLGGVLVAMSPQKARHVLVTAAVHEALVLRLPRGRWRVCSHSPLKVSASSKPEPDVYVVPRTRELVEPRDAVLVVEVSDSSLVKDRDVKRHFYAAARIPEYWIVDLKREVIEVRTRPVGRDYARLQELGRGDTLGPVGLRGVRIPVADVLPPPRPRRRR